MVARIAVIGGGQFGEMHLRAFAQMQREGRARLVGLADINEAVLARRHDQYGVAGYPDFKEMLERTDPDAVAIATPDHLHHDAAVCCLKAGKHVLIEKPMDVTLPGCRDIVNLAEERGLLVQVNFHKRFDPYHGRLRDLVAGGCLGEIEYGYAHIEDRIDVPRDWLRTWAARSSPVWFLGVHMYDLVRWLVRAEFRSVSATGSKKKLIRLGIDTYDSVQAKLALDNGGSFTVDSSWILPEAFEAVVNQGIRVVGTEGIMEVDSQDRGARACAGMPGGGAADRGPSMQTPNMGFYFEVKNGRGLPRYGGYGITSIQDFGENVNRILEGASPADLGGVHADGRDGLEATRVAAAVHESLEGGGRIVDLQRDGTAGPHALEQPSGTTR
ncbi:MAG: Gfo/Idh/MocA family oxidoreductase [Acidobacteria bacterium]|nr:Gfo/Idh/MocA family oxidoreductase [Acidobacteriota bacterium]